MKSTTVREELVVALFDDAADIVKRLEALVPVMDDTRFALAQTARDLASQVKPFQRQMHQIGMDVQYKAVHYVRDQVEQTSRVSRELEAEALKEAGRAVLKEEVGRTLHQLVASLQEIVKESRRREALLVKVTTAAVSVAGTAGVAVCLLAANRPAAEHGLNAKDVIGAKSPSSSSAALVPERARDRR